LPVITADIIGDVANYYYSQFELCTREQKMNQIVLLQVWLFMTGLHRWCLVLSMLWRCWLDIRRV